MVSQDRSAMKDAISEVLETMFYVSVDFGEDLLRGEACDCESLIALYNEVQNVEISFKTREEFARMLSANLLGVDENEVSSDDLEDTMKEFTNMVTGSYKSRIDMDNEWELGIPRIKMTPRRKDSSIAGLVFSCYGKPMGKVTWQSES